LKVLKNKYKLVSIIKGHESPITTIRYFLNKTNNTEYIISADYDGIIILTSVTEDFKIISKFKTDYISGQLSSCLMIFELNEPCDFDIKNGLLLTSSKKNFYNQDLPMRLYALNGKGSFDNIKEYFNFSNNTSYILHWYNKKTKTNYIIDLEKNKIIIISLLSGNIYNEYNLNLNTWYHSGLIYYDAENDRDILYINTIISMVLLLDLHNNQIIGKIKTSSQIERLYGMIQWNENYILIAGATTPDIKVIDIKEQKCVGNIFIGHNDDFRCLRKIKHPKFGYCVITGSDDYTLKLYKLKEI
jgi:WD40 repeat protein